MYSYPGFSLQQFPGCEKICPLLCIPAQIVLFYSLKLDLIMKNIIYIILAFITAGLTFAFLVKKMKDDCIP